MSESSSSTEATQEETTILVVDDEEDICRSLETFLEGSMQETRVRSVQSGSEALTFLEAYEVDLIITDYRMPDLDGLAFLQKVRELRPDTPRIMMTAYPDLNLAMQAINEEKVDAFLTKPLEPLELVQTVRQTLREHRRG